MTTAPPFQISDLPADIQAVLAEVRVPALKDLLDYPLLIWAIDHRSFLVSDLIRCLPTAERQKAQGQRTPLMVACGSRYSTQLVPLLLSVPDFLAHKDSFNARGQTALAVACEANPSLVPLLLAAGFDPNARRPGDRTPLMYACRSGNADDAVDAVAALLAAGADPDATDEDGQSALMFAAAFSPPCMEPLVAAGASLTMVTDQGEDIVTAAARFNPDSLVALLRWGADTGALEALLANPERQEAVLPQSLVAWEAHVAARILNQSLPQGPSAARPRL